MSELGVSPPLIDRASGGTAAAAPERTTLPSTIAEQLRQMITEGELLAGTRLNERTLGVRLGVSRTPLREAFRLLAADGLIELTPNRGAQVVSLSEQDIRDSFEVMSGLEALSGELACRHVTADEIAEIKALTFEMLACHARHDRGGDLVIRVASACRAVRRRPAGARALQPDRRRPFGHAAKPDPGACRRGAAECRSRLR